jgi:hypothetical protein
LILTKGRRVFEDEVRETFNPEDDPVLKQLQKDASKVNLNAKVQHAIDANPNVTAHKPKVCLGNYQKYNLINLIAFSSST